MCNTNNCFILWFSWMAEQLHGSKYFCLKSTVQDYNKSKQNDAKCCRNDAAWYMTIYAC